MTSFTRRKQEWLKGISDGRAEDVIKDIQITLKSDKEDRFALSLLTTLASEVSVLASTDIYQVCLVCLDAMNICVLMPQDKHRCLVAVFHLTRFFINQENIEAGVKISSFLYPVKCSSKDDACTNAIYSCFYLFRNITHRKRQEISNGKGNLSDILENCKHSLKLLSCCTGKYLLIILNTAANLVSSGKLRSKEDRLRFVEFLLQVVDLTSVTETERGQNVTNEEIFRCYMLVLFPILQHQIDAGCIKQAEDNIKKIFSFAEAWIGKNRVFNDCATLFRNIFSAMHPKHKTFMDTLQICVTELGKLVIRYGDKPYINWTCVTISRVVICLYAEWSSLGAEKWNELMPVESQKMLFSLIYPLSEVLVTTDCLRCLSPTGEQCPVKTDLVTSLNILAIVLQCVSQSIIHRTSGFEVLLSEAHSTVNEIITRLKKLKAENCFIWKDQWKCIAIKIYNSGIYCRGAGLMVEAKEFFSSFCWACIELGEQPAQEDGKGLLGNGLLLLAQTQKELKKLRGALRSLSLGIVVDSEMKDRYSQQWAKVKISSLSSKCNEIQNLTIYDVLMDFKSVIEVRSQQQIQFSDIDFPQLLMWELQAYNTYSVGSSEPSNAVFNKLCSIASRDSVLKLDALLMLFPSVWINGNIEHTLQIISTAKSLIEQSDKDDTIKVTSESLCLLGNLHYWIFMCQLKVTRSKQEQEIESANIIIPITSEIQKEDNPDPLQKCDVVPAYKNLSIKNESEILSILNNAVSFWSSGHKLGLSTISKNQNPLPNIEVAAFIYDMYGYDIEKLRTWSLYYRCAESLNQIDMMLAGICQLMECCTCGKAKCVLVARAQELVTQLELAKKEDTDSKLLYHKYLLAYCYHCLRSKQFSEIPRYLEELSEYSKKDKDKRFSFSLLYTKVAFLACHCMHLPHSYAVTCPSRGSKHLVNEAILAYTNAVCLSKQNRMTPVEYAEIIGLLLNISLWIGQLHLGLFWPREARCYMKGNLLLSQKLGLATRSSQFLNLLALVDVMCCNTDDCQVKLQGMEVLLQLELSNQPYEPVTNDFTKNTGIVEELSSRLKQLNMEKPRWIEELRFCNKTPHASPRLRKVKFITPSFLNDPSDCSCYMCCNPALQNLVLCTTYIQAEIYNIKSETKEAVEFFEGAAHIYKKLVQKQETVTQKLHSELIDVIKGNVDALSFHEFLCLPLKLGYLKMGKAYADFWGASGLYKQAEEWNIEVSQEPELWIWDHLLASDILDQTFCIEYAQHPAIDDKKEEEQESSKYVKSETFMGDSCKTPLNSTSASMKVNIADLFEKMIKDDSPYRPKPRKLILPEKDVENERNVLPIKSGCTAKKREKKATIVYEDSPDDKMSKAKLNSRKSQTSVKAVRIKVTADTGKTLRSTRCKPPAKSLSKVCQTLYFNGDTPDKNEKLQKRKKPSPKPHNPTEVSTHHFTKELGIDWIDTENNINGVFSPSSEVLQKLHKLQVLKQVKRTYSKHGSKLPSYAGSNLHSVVSKSGDKAVGDTNISDTQPKKEIICNEKSSQKPSVSETAIASTSDAKVKQKRGRLRALKEEKTNKIESRQARDKVHTTNLSRFAEISEEAVANAMDHLSLCSKPIESVGVRNVSKKKLNSKKEIVSLVFTPKRIDGRINSVETIAPASPEVIPSAERKRIIVPSSPDSESDCAGVDGQRNTRSRTANNTKTRHTRATARKNKRLPVKNPFVLN